MAQTPTSYVESWKGKWTWNREGLQLPLVVAEAWPPKPGGWKNVLPACQQMAVEREREIASLHMSWQQAWTLRILRILFFKHPSECRFFFNGGVGSLSQFGFYFWSTSDLPWTLWILFCFILFFRGSMRPVRTTRWCLLCIYVWQWGRGEKVDRHTWSNSLKSFREYDDPWWPVCCVVILFSIKHPHDTGYLVEERPHSLILQSPWA